MIPNVEEIQELHRRYAQSEIVFNLVYGHCSIVNEIALWCVEENNLEVNRELLSAGCLLHDIGTYALFNEEGSVKNEYNYMQHAIFGAALAIEEGFDNRIAEMIRTHVLMGLSRQEIKENKFGMPQNDYLPASLEARLLCYADRFHSKLPTFNAYEAFLSKISKGLPEQGRKLQEAAAEFGVPDIQAFANKYNQPILK